MILNHWLSITLHDSRPLVPHNTPCFTNQWFRIAHHDSQPLVQHTSPWFISTGIAFTLWFIHTERSIAHNASQPLAQHNTPWFSGRESWRVMLSQWLRIMLCYYKPVVVNNGESCCASGFESCAMLSQWLWNMVNHFLPVGVNHVVLWCTSIRESWRVIFS
jgi:hypothetical protein